MHCLDILGNMSLHQPFKPSFGGKVIVIGCSDKNGRANLQELKPGPKVTTYQRTAAALEAYWAERAAAGKIPAGDKVPGGEQQLAFKTREACWKDSVHLEQDVLSVLPEWQGTPSDIEDKEQIRTRGIPGFTGKQPPAGQSKPPQPVLDTSSWVAINAFDEPKPRVKGIVGYTGHQPPSPAKNPADHHQQQKQQQQCATGVQHQAQQMDPQARAAWCNQCSNTTNRSAAPSTGLRISAAAPGYLGLTHATAEQHTNRPRSNASEASTVYVPRFFLNGVEVPPDGVQVPRSPCTAVTAVHHPCIPAAGPGAHFQHQQQSHAAAARQAEAGGPPRPQAVWGFAGGSGSAPAAAPCLGRSSSAVMGCTHGATYCTQQQQQQPSCQLVGPRRTRATTYAAAFSDASGFGIQKYLETLQLTSSLRPARAYAAVQQQDRL